MIAWVREQRRGVAAVEFALVATPMLILMLGVYDVANAVQERLLMQQALRAGGQYAISFPPPVGDITSSGAAAVVSAVNQALPQSWKDNPPAITVTFPACSGICIGLAATRPYVPFLPGLLAENSATYVIRVQ